MDDNYCSWYFIDFIPLSSCTHFSRRHGDVGICFGAEMFDADQGVVLYFDRRKYIWVQLADGRPSVDLPRHQDFEV